jgi:hypothetical protein
VRAPSLIALSTMVVMSYVAAALSAPTLRPKRFSYFCANSAARSAGSDSAKICPASCPLYLSLRTGDVARAENVEIGTVMPA